MYPWRPLYRIAWRFTTWHNRRSTGEVFDTIDDLFAALDAAPPAKPTLLHRADDWCHRSRLPFWCYRPLCDWQEMRVTGRPWSEASDRRSLWRWIMDRIVPRTAVNLP